MTPELPRTGRSLRRVSSRSELSRIPGVPPEAVLGPLNAVEQKNSPELLFIAGDANLLRHHPRVSVVGSRAASPEGERRAARLARVLVEHNAIVVSGLALGVDATAHRTAIAAGGRTIAVIGTPLDKVYPKAHEDLQAQIARDHLVISQFPSGSVTKPYCFPKRNRTMALIVDASVIVEAGDSSGTLSQGWEALRLGRPLFIMKSVAEDPRLKWPRDMQDYGALVLTKPEDLLDMLPYGEPELAELSV